MSDPNSRECSRCGKCCFEPFYRHVRPEDEDLWRERGRRDLIEIEETESSRRDNMNTDMAGRGLALCSCRFLRADGPGRFACAIYELRPITCREFEVGCSRLCPQYQGRTPPRFKGLFPKDPRD